MLGFLILTIDLLMLIWLANFGLMSIILIMQMFFMLSVPPDETINLYMGVNFYCIDIPELDLDGGASRFSSF